MAMARIKDREIFIEYELEFLEKKLKELKKYISDNPFNKLDDRSGICGIKNNKDGSTFETWKVIATKEVQRRDLALALKDYAEILKTVDMMRTQEAKKEVAVRGDEKLGSQAKAFLESREK